MQYSDRITRLKAEGAFAVLAECRRMEAEGKSIIHLQIGEPDFDTPGNISEAAIKAIRDGHTHYSPSGGTIEARAAVAEHIKRTRGIETAAEDVVIMPGVKPVIFGAIMGCINAGDEVICPNPGYPTYESVVNFVGAKPVPVPLREENDFRFDVNELRSLVTPRTKMIILNSPENPTGGVLTRSDMEAIYEVAEENDLWILTDEIYSGLVYDGEFVSIGSVPGAMKRTILMDGMSKTYAMTGWRMGYGVMPRQLADYLSTLAVNNFSCPASMVQVAMMEAFVGPMDEVNIMVEEFRKRRDVIVDGLNKIDGISCLKPQGAFYVFPNVKELGMTSQEVFDLLLYKAGVAGLPGTAFGKHGEGYIRFSYANSIENIQEALRRIEKILAEVRAKA
ncbi:aminotransferase class I/II-fold pyridoxal phosphate-dependent enzyme [candidate division GN15 bacterium]|nr:aminotransferase class I/II-fold pyridoxal phosphate-dependent enzyme [candidate division GN15 bacterium]